MRPQILLLLALFLAVLPPSAVADSGDVGDPWVEIEDLNDPQIQSMAKFAVTEHNGRSGEGLVYKRLLLAKVENVDDTNYLLNIATDWQLPPATKCRPTRLSPMCFDNSPTPERPCYDALILEIDYPDGWELVSFDKAPCYPRI
ncbi:hypothetical protein BT93_D0910 [Corymbia citriodora subsp. variegata]|nr:hypothetical protein BT93_D0910 [Corymbia citriodora subsp. variegata]